MNALAETPETRIDTDDDRRRWLALYVLCAGVLMIVLDATIVNVALPSIQDDLGFSNSSLAWVVNAYLIAFGGLLLLAGRLGDLVGQRRVFLIGLTIFTIASVFCAMAQSEGVLIGARFVQGIGGALTSAVVLGMLVTMFPEPREQAKAMGVYGFVASAGGSIGLLLGGILTDAISWHWIFFINVPIGIATALLARRLVEPRPGIGLGEGADLPGAVILVTGLMIGVYSILQVSEQGWTLGPDARPRPRLGRPRRRVRDAPGADREPAHAAAAVPLAQRRRSQHRDGAAGRGDVRDVLPRRALHAADPRLRPAPGRARLPALDDRHGHDVAALLGAPEHALRPAHDADRRHVLDPRRPAALLTHAGRRQLHRRPRASDDADRPRRRRRLPGAGDARDVGRDAERLRARLRARQRDRAGRRRDRARRAGDARRRAHRLAARRAAPRTTWRSTPATTWPI